MDAERPVISDGLSRAERYRRRQEADGLVQVSAWLPSSAVADFYVLASRLRDDRELGFGPLRHVASGRLRKV